jgi:hypothetical protein
MLCQTGLHRGRTMLPTGQPCAYRPRSLGAAGLRVSQRVRCLSQAACHRAPDRRSGEHPSRGGTLRGLVPDHGLLCSGNQGMAGSSRAGPANMRTSVSANPSISLEGRLLAYRLRYLRDVGERSVCSTQSHAWSGRARCTLNGLRSPRPWWRVSCHSRTSVARVVPVKDHESSPL